MTASCHRVVLAMSRHSVHAIMQAKNVSFCACMQRWMPLVPWCHTLGSLFMAYVFPPDAMPLWAKTVRGGWVAVATVLLIACGEQV